jgi:hypothetical protein
VNRINKNVDLLKKLDTVKLISPRDITIASIPLIIQRALILGPKFIYDNSLSTNKIVSQLRNNRAVKLNSEQFRHLTNDLNNAPPSKKPQAINTKDLKTVMKRWLDDNNLIIQNADKNLCLALIDKDIYQQHLDALISNTDLYIPISEADAKQFLKEFEAAIHELYFNFHKERRYKSHIAKHTSFGFPNLYLIPKIHKPKLAMRPIVNQRNFLFSEVYKEIHQFYLEKLNKQKDKPTLVLDGNLDLILKIDKLNQLIEKENINLDEYQILSLDVTNLYGNIDLEDIMEVIKEVTDMKDKEDLFYYRLTQQILPNSIIESQGNLYIQANGLAMGINYAPSLANLYLFARIDTKVLRIMRSKDKPFAPVLFYARYLDDILIFRHKSRINFDGYVKNHLNAVHSSIQFTTEHSVNNSINFLDLTISIVNNRIEYRNYIKDRKST